MKVEQLQGENMIYLKDKLQGAVNNIKQVIKTYNTQTKLLEKFTKTYNVIIKLKFIQECLEDYIVKINEDINSLEIN